MKKIILKTTTILILLILSHLNINANTLNNKINTILHNPKAEEEFELAIDFYEEARKNLGEEFIAEVYQAIKRVNDFPEAWHVKSLLKIYENIKLTN